MTDRPVLLAAFAATLGVLLGVASVVAGGADDSPGLQGIGVLLVVGSVALLVRYVRRRGTGPS
ncbi:hypothetical protein SAMN03159343_0313 [Klenkia marina]|uniref:Uncharacterized protein n=1 Tax=Klenkia marina TaxID=1960309 RepID=A0A1G4XAH0_9ACTN|nr:hypothetical protein [Klenkia marina]SCX38142.1 hypothetical protein SAMN03159343_0313 [Klenkia marina]